MTHTATSHGRTFSVVEGATHPAYSLSCFDEERAFRELYFRPQPGEFVIDIGASYGAYTLPACAAGAQVLAIEPELSVFTDLCRNVQANKWADRCTLMQCGLWSSHARVDMRDYAPHWPPGTISAPFTMFRLDSFAVELPRVDWVKLDVEGAELHVLLGAKRTIERHRPRLIIECHTFMLADVVDRAKDMIGGYEWEEIPREPCVMLVGRSK